MQYPIIDLIASAYINNGWTGFDIPQTITYEPIQLGSGTPSPDNVRPILPAATLNIGGTDVPVYGGTLDVTTGVLTIDKNKINVIDLSWDYNTPESGIYRALCPDCVQPDRLLPTTAISDQLKAEAYGPISSTDFACFAISDTGIARIVITTNRTITSLDDFLNQWGNITIVYPLVSPITYTLTNEELQNIIGIKDDIAHRLKLPLPHYFPHPVIDALQRAAAGTQTADDTEILQHYLTPLGIGGI